VPGAGIIAAATLPAVRLTLAVDLAPPAAAPRLPEPSTVAIEGVALPRLVLAERATDTAAMSLAALLLGDGLTAGETRPQRLLADLWPTDGTPARTAATNRESGERS
jgi:hypothetical protein